MLEENENAKNVFILYYIIHTSRFRFEWLFHIGFESYSTTRKEYRFRMRIKYRVNWNIIDCAYSKYLHLPYLYEHICKCMYGITNLQMNYTHTNEWINVKIFNIIISRLLSIWIKQVVMERVHWHSCVIGLHPSILNFSISISISHPFVKICYKLHISNLTFCYKN